MNDSLPELDIAINQLLEKWKDTVCNIELQYIKKFMYNKAHSINKYLIIRYTDQSAGDNGIQQCNLLANDIIDFFIVDHKTSN